MTEKPRTDEQILDAVEKAARSLRRQEVMLAIASFVVGLGYLIVMLRGLSIGLRDLVSSPTRGQWVTVGWYLFLFTMLYHVAHFPVAFLRGYVVERRFRLSKQRFRRWMWAQAKKYLVSAVLVVFAGSLLYYFLRRFDRAWWLLAWVGYVVFALVINRFGGRILLPIFYKRGELADDDLKTRLEALVTRAGFQVESVKRIILDQDTRRANAAVLGLGKSKEILVSDTLLAVLAPGEIEAVVAHELGHLKRRHSELLFAAAMFISFVGFVLAAGVLYMSVESLGLSGVSDVAGFPLIVLVFTGLFFIVNPIVNYISRQMEFAADAYAAAFTGEAPALASALVKLAATNLAEKDHPWLYEVLFSAHPSPAKRVARLELASKASDKA